MGGCNYRCKIHARLYWTGIGRTSPRLARRVKVRSTHTHFVNRSEYMSTSCLARSIGLGPAGGSGSEFPNQLIFSSYTRTKCRVVAAQAAAAGKGAPENWMWTPLAVHWRPPFLRAGQKPRAMTSAAIPDDEEPEAQASASTAAEAAERKFKGEWCLGIFFIVLVRRQSSVTFSFRAAIRSWLVGERETDSLCQRRHTIDTLLDCSGARNGVQ